ncbi:MAG TPA: MATE family efflux transporter [Thermoanaerobaculia bacterium]|nr:MATE family efflux transporter [Thermoanaerobaculia bacterium]
MSRSIDISYRRILQVTAPVLVTQLSYTAMGAIDTMMVGRLGVLELGAVGLGNLLTWWFLSFFFGLLTGVSAFVAQAVGAGRGRRVGVVLWQGVALAAASGVTMLLCWPLAPTVFAWTGATEGMQSLATEYSQIRLLGGLGLCLLLVADNFYRGLGRTQVPMVCAISQLVLNCGLNYLLIYGKAGFPALGVRGAAVGTIVAQSVIGLVLFATILGNRRFRAEFELASSWRPDRAVLRSLALVSLPIATQTFLEMGGISVFSGVVARLGEAQMAATNAVIQAWSLAFMSALALSVGATTLAGQCLGAGDIAGARRATSRIMRLGLGLTAAISVLYLTAPEWLISLFVRAGDAEALLPYARPLFTVVVICLFFDLRFNVLAGALRGAGDTTYSMAVTIGSAWLVFVPATLFATPRFGLVGAWWCLVIHVALMTALLELRYRGSRWVHSLVDEEPVDGSRATPIEGGPAGATVPVSVESKGASP